MQVHVKANTRSNKILKYDDVDDDNNNNKPN